jgi:hypothetical protein
VVAEMKSFVHAIAQAVGRCIQSPLEPVDQWVRPYVVPSLNVPGINQFLIMLKPELVVPESGDSAAVAFARVFSLLTEHEVELGATRVLSSSYLSRHKVIEWHYSMLNHVSRDGLAGISASARKRLYELFPDALNGNKAHVLGGHQFLVHFPQFTPFALDVLARNVQVIKLGAGTYAIEVFLDGKPWLVLNAFHPAQLEHFTVPGRAVVIIECRSARHLSDIRRTTIGATDPREAVPGSIKRVLLDEQSELGLCGISIRQNAVHMSPGPVEAMFGVQRYFSRNEELMPLHDTVFGGKLMLAGFMAKAAQALGSNPEVELLDRSGPLFEVTEDLNWNEALTIVTSLLSRASEDPAAR